MNQNAQELFSKNVGTSRKPFYFGLVGAIAGFLLVFPYFEEFIDDGALQATEILSVVGVLIIGALIGVGIAKWKSISNNIKFGLIGAILGALFGVPASYFMQSGFFRGFVPVVKYITNFPEYIQRTELQSTAIVGIVLGAIIGTVIGVIVARKKGVAASK